METDLFQNKDCKLLQCPKAPWDAKVPKLNLCYCTYGNLFFPLTQVFDLLCVCIIGLQSEGSHG